MKSAYVLFLAVLINSVAFCETWNDPKTGIPWSYKNVAGGLEIVGGENLEDPAIPATTKGVVEVPASINGISVVGIGQLAFSACDEITGVTIPSCVRYIGRGSFSGCKGIASLKISEGVEIVDEGAFMGCNSLISVVVPQTVTNIGAKAFASCEGLQSVKLPLRDATIGAHAFSWCYSIGSIEISDSVNSIRGTFSESRGIISNVVLSAGATRIEDYEFHSCSKLKNITIPMGVEYIGQGAFNSCSELESIKIPSSVRGIGSRAFAFCDKLKSMEVPGCVTMQHLFDVSYSIPVTNVVIADGSTEIWSYAFLGSQQLETISIPESVIKIGSLAFEGCFRLKSITLPSGITELPVDVFSLCESLQEILVNKDNTVFASREGVLYDHSLKKLLCWPPGLECRRIPDGTTEIVSDSFYCAHLGNELVIPGSVKKIHDNAFNYGELERLTLPACDVPLNTMCPRMYQEIKEVVISGGNEIGESMFLGCSKLQKVEITDGIVKIGARAFEGCSSLLKLVVPPGVREIGGWNTFKDCSTMTKDPLILEFTGDAPVVSPFDFDMFKGARCNLYVPRDSEGWDQDGDGKWCGQSINYIDYFEVEFDIGICKYKGGGALHQYLRQGAYPTMPIYDIPLGYISQGWDNDPTLPITSSIKHTLKLKLDVSEHAEKVGDYTWQYRITPQGAVIDSGKSCVPAVTPSPEGAIAVPETLGSMGVVGVGTYAFYGCDRMTSIALPKDLAEIAYYAFKGCSSLKSINIPSGVREIGFYAFNGCVSLTDIAIPESVESIGESAFLNCTGLGNGVVIKNGCVLTVNGQCPASVDLPEGTRLVAGAAFKDCQTLTAVKFPSTLKTIETYAFSGCTMLTSVYIPDSVTRIGYSAFLRDSKLGTVRLSNSLKAIEMDVFSRCGSLTEIDIPNGVGEIGVGAFGVCSKLQRASIPESVTNIMTQAFSDCSELREITLPSKLKKISSSLFRGCGNLPSIVLPYGVSEIQHDAFEGCASLNSVIIPFGVRNIDYNAFRDCAKLQIISVPKSVDAIGEYAFYNCAGITEIHVAKGDSARVKDMLTASKSDLKYASIQFIELDDPIPELLSDATADEVASALNGSVDARLILCITDAETYSQYRAWALKIGADEVKNSENAWVSFALDSDALLEKSPGDEDLAIEEFKPTDEAGKFDFTVRVKDIEIGSGALAENLKKVFGLTGATTLDVGAFKQENVDVEFDAPKDGMLKFTAKPVKVSDRFFMSVKVK